MSEKDLGKALLDLDAAAVARAPNAKDQVAKVLQRDRGRVKLWTLLTAGTWLLAVLLVFGVLIYFGLLFPLHAHLKSDEWKGRITPEQHAQAQDDAQIGFMMGTVFIALSVVVLSAAALCTLFLLFASRLATLRQVNAQLMDISEQLKQLRQAGTGPPSPG
jgi:hypothetical protein